MLTYERVAVSTANAWLAETPVRAKLAKRTVSNFRSEIVCKNRIIFKFFLLRSGLPTVLRCWVRYHAIEIQVRVIHLALTPDRTGN